MSEEFEIIKKLYYKLNKEFLSTQPFNTKEIRHETICKILYPLEDMFAHGMRIRVICDETNNTSEVIDNNQLVAKVEWKNGKFGELKYVDLTFGNVEVVWD
jgi:hypothetical protein